MPLVKLLRPALIGAMTHHAGYVFECDRRQLEHYVQSGAGIEVPAGTVSDEPEDAPASLETTKAERAVETTRRTR